MSHHTWKRRPISSIFGAVGLSLLLAAAPVFAQSTSSSGTTASDQSLSGQSSTQGSTTTSGATGSASSSDRSSTPGMSSSSGDSGTSGTSGSSGTTGVTGSSGATGRGTTSSGTSGSTTTGTAADTSGTGTTGASGTASTTGTSPSTGSTGALGSTGTTGSSGATGTTSGATGATAADTGATGGGAYVPSGKSTVATSDRNLMRQLAYTNISEIEAAKLVQSKSKNDEVLNFARQMLDDHTKALDRLQQLAQQKGVQLPTEPDTKHKAMAKKLEAMSGEAFDREYLAKAGVSAHTQAHQLLTRVQSRAKDADLKQLATELHTNVNHHLQMAKELRSGKATSTGSSGATSNNSSSGASSKQSGAQSGSHSTDKSGGSPAGK